MAIEIQIPEFPESISEGTIGSWIKSVGDTVTEGETIVEVETDKVVLEIPAPADGVIEKIIKAENEQVTSRQVIGMLTPQEASDENVPEPASKQKEETSVDTGNTGNDQNHENDKDRQQSPGRTEIKKTSPATRKHMHENNVGLEEVTATGKNNRVTKKDIDQVRKQQTSAENAVERVPMSSLRKKISDRLVTAQQEYAMLTTFNEINMQRVIDIRSSHKNQFLEKYEIKLGFMSFFVLAAVEALKAHPVINASVDNNDILYHQYIDIGVAVSTDRGLVVPVLRDVDQKSLANIEIEINQLAEKARHNKLDIDDLTGGTFTITNGGVFGSMLSTPIINPPQSAILGMHAIEKRPIVVHDEIRIAPMMYLALSYDHRIIDGREAVLFLAHIKKIIEDPIQLLLHI